jgi:hypothetical protein
MNAPYFSPFADSTAQPGAIAQPGHNSADDQMEQIQDLLIGEHKRETCRRLSDMETQIKVAEARFSEQLAALSAKLDMVVAELKGERSAGETAVLHRIQTIDARVGTIAGAIEAGHRATFESLSRGVIELGSHLQRAAKP